MANTLSNLYVERAASEHPLALWSLNESTDYVSILFDEERKLYLFEKWEIVEGEATTFPSTSLLNTPFINAETIKFEGYPPDDVTGSFFAKGKFNFKSRLADGFGSFAFGFFAYIDSSLIDSVSLGYVYIDGESNEQEVISTFTVKASYIDKWTQFLDTFEMPPSNATNVRYLVKFNSREGGVEGAYNVYINGMTAGHWAEDFMATSFGVEPSPMPDSIALPSSLKVSSAFPYGSSGDLGYYITSENKLRCKNFGVPLVYGSSEVTKIYPNTVSGTEYPSLIFPGYGFLNQRGKNNDYTVEMWLRVNSASSAARKIFGPIASDDGLYVDESFITLRIGKSYSSHFIGEWYRPMLVHIRLVQDSAVVVLNGEEIMNFDIDENSKNFPLETLNGQSQDWLGFYAYDDVPLIDLDSFSIYSYGIPTQVAKRRFVWGQAVTAPEQTNSAVNAVTAFNDYAFANYAANYNYPDFANWRQAFFSNLDADTRALKLPEYQLPAFRLVDRNVQELFNQLQNIEPTLDPDDVANKKYFTLGLGQSSEEYIYFEDLKVLNDILSSVYGIFKTDGTAVNQPLIKITNKISKDNILVTLNGTTLTYTSDINNVRTTLAIKTVIANKRFNVGLNIENISKKQILGLKAFFTDTSLLDMYVAGDGNSKFTGKIYAIGFDAGYNNRYIEDYYDSDGIFTFDYSTISNAAPIATAISSTGTVEAITNTGVSLWTGRVSNLSSISGLSIGDVVTATSGTGSLGSGGKYVVTEIGLTSFDFSATGGTTPIAGNITDINKNTVTYTINNNFIPTDTVLISGITPTGYNSSTEVEVVSYTDNSFTINSSATGSYVSGGMVSRNKDLIDHTANYTLVPIDKYGVFFADIAVSGYWEDYMPLSYFAKYVLDNDGNKRYDLDFLQFNVDFPEPNALNILEETRAWTYGELTARYRSPQILLYRDLNNKFFTKWENYQDMSEDSVKTIFFNTEKSSLRSYISFQELSDGANRNLIDFEEIARPLANEVVDPDGLSFDWKKTAYEITTGSIVYPPKTVNRIINNIEQARPVNFKNLALVYHLNFKSEGIVHQPIKIKELQLASQVFERTRLTPVGSKFGVPVFYYSKPGFYFDLKGKNPVATYKRSTPHLYLNRQSGWKLRGDFDINTDRGLAMPINQSGALDTEVSSVQLWVRFSEKEFPGERVKIFSIAHNGGVYDFYVQGDPSLLRGEIFGIDKDTGEPLEDLNYFINGKQMVKPYIIKEEWAVVSVEFPNLLNFSGQSGYFNLNGPLTYNNISYNLSTNLEQNKSFEARVWGDLLTVRTATISNAISADGETTYTVNKKFEIGQKVTISGITPSAYNTDPNEPATIISVNQGETVSTFTIAKTVEVPYSGSGIAQASAWDYLDTDLIVTDDSKPPFQWKQVRVLSESRSFNINPETIYSKYTGSDRIIIDDESNGLLVKPELFTLFNQVVWRESTKIPV